MKKAKYIIIAVLFAIYITTQTTNPLVMGFVYAKHISLFLMIGIVVYYITNYVTDLTISRFNLAGTKETLAHTLKIIVFTGVLALTSILQLGLIEYYDTPYVTGCIHYDTFGNEIYISKTRGTCPTLNILESSDSVLKFEVSEIYHSKLDTYVFPGEIMGYEDVDYNVNYLTTKRIKYDQNERITEIVSNHSVIIQIIAKNKIMSEYRSVSNIIINSYDNGFTQVIKNASKSESFNETFTGVINHTSFEEEDYETITYFTEETGIDDIITLYKRYLLEDEMLIDEIATFSYVLDGETIIYDVQDISSNLINIQRDQELSIRDDSITITNILDGENSDTIISEHYLKDSDYGYLKISENSIVTENNTTRHNETNYTFSEIEGRDYIISHFTSDMDFNFTIEDKIYELETTFYGKIVHYLDFHEESYLTYLKNKDVSESSIFLYYQLGDDYPYFFESNYSITYSLFKNIIYSKPNFLPFY